MKKRRPLSIITALCIALAVVVSVLAVVSSFDTDTGETFDCPLCEKGCGRCDNGRVPIVDGWRPRTGRMR